MVFTRAILGFRDGIKVFTRAILGFRDGIMVFTCAIWDVRSRIMKMTRAIWGVIPLFCEVTLCLKRSRRPVCQWIREEGLSHSAPSTLASWQT